jgi:hypothetical protein
MEEGLNFMSAPPRNFIHFSLDHSARLLLVNGFTTTYGRQADERPKVDAVTEKLNGSVAACEVCSTSMEGIGRACSVCSDGKPKNGLRNSLCGVCNPAKIVTVGRIESDLSS